MSSGTGSRLSTCVQSWNFSQAAQRYAYDGDAAVRDQVYMEYLRRCWLPFSWSYELKDRPIARCIIGRKLVAYRDNTGRAVLMEDRCAHRGVALSEGHLIDGCIMCPYHGWRYDQNGRCVRIPSLLPEETMPDF